jgi:hypothetical protein
MRKCAQESVADAVRFLIVDLRMKPACGRRWPKTLENSERTFHQELAGHGYHAHRKRTCA